MKRLLLPLILVCVAICIAAVAYIFLIHLQKPSKGEIIVAKNNIPSGTIIGRTMITSIRWEGEIPEGFIDIKATDKVLNRVAAVDILRGTPISDGCLAPKGSPSGLFAKIPEGMRAMTVKVDEVSGVAGFSGPGSRVDVLLAGTGNKLDGKEEPTSKIILQNVLVLAYGQRITKIEGKDKPEVEKTATLLVSPEEAEKLALAIKMGTLLLTLRAGGDTTSVKTRGLIPKDVWGTSTKEEASATVEIIQGGVTNRIKVEEQRVEGEEQTMEGKLSALSRGI